MKTKSLRIFTILVVLTLLAAVCIGCKDTYSSDDKTYPVSGRTYIEEKYNNTELHFAKRTNTLKEIVLTEAGTKSTFDMHFVMIADTIYTYYNNTEFDTIGTKYIYYDSYLTHYNDESIRLYEKK